MRIGESTHLLFIFCQRGGRVFSHYRPLLVATRRVESRPFGSAIRLIPTSSARSLFTSAAMSDSDFVSRFSQLSIKPHVSVSHASASSPAAWREALATSPNVPKDYQLTKVLVFKPKTAKAATPVPVVVIARDETETTSNSLAKKLNLKELRLASADLLAMTFGCDKDSCELSVVVFWNEEEPDQSII